jgi:4-alpha-glucanotransferase
MDVEALQALSVLAGIERAYVDQLGTPHEVEPQTVEDIARAMGLLAGGGFPEPASPLDPVTVWLIERGAPEVALRLPRDAADARIGWRVVAEDGARHAGEARIGDLATARPAAEPDRHERRLLCLPHLPLGYHRLSVDCGAVGAAEALLIVAPSRAYLPPGLESGTGVWGIAVQLYAVRSPHDWGIGDFRDLTDLVRRAAAAGADLIGLNPLHALCLDEPERASPYSPSSRVFLNPLYIAIESVPDYAACGAARDRVAAPAFQAALGALRRAALVDYPAVARLKVPVLELLYDWFRTHDLAAAAARGQSFRAFQRQGGETLRRFCIFQALREARAQADAGQRDWRNWPEAYRDPASPAVARFAADQPDRIEFFEYLQWIADEQLGGCAAAAHDAGMMLGLYRDLAVGVDAGASDAWSAQDTIVGGWSVGAPPDALARDGQDWGLAPLNPVALRRTRYRPFIEMVRANMRYAGALRIDHALGLWRSFWIREGESPARGAYVRNPFHDLVAILALESHRARCMVIGEDLGTVPDGLRAALEQANILSYRILYFEKDENGRFCRPEDFPRCALVAVNTHDLPTLPGYWCGADVTLRASLGLADEEEARVEREWRVAERAALSDALRAEGLGAPETDDAVPVEAAYRYLARTPSLILVIHLEDVLGVIDQINVPGTLDQHPNWRRRWPADLASVFADPRVRSLLRAVGDERPSRCRSAEG